MAFANPVGPKFVAQRSGIRYDPATGLMIIFTSPGDPIRVDGFLDLSDGLVSYGPVIGRAGLYTGGTDPDGGHQVFPTTCGIASGNTNALGEILVPHLGHTTPSAVFWQVASGTPAGATITHLNRGPALILAELRNAAGALLPATAFSAFWLAVFPS